MAPAVAPPHSTISDKDDEYVLRFGGDVVVLLDHKPHGGRYPKTVAATKLAGHLAPDADEWLERTGMTLDHAYASYVLRQLKMLRPDPSFYVPDWFMMLNNVRIAALDLKTGTTAAGTYTTAGKPPAQQDPRFIRPLASSTMAEFRRKCDARPRMWSAINLSPPILFDPAGKCPSLESLTPDNRLFAGFELLYTLTAWVRHNVYNKDCDFEETWVVNPAWDETDSVTLWEEQTWTSTVLWETPAPSTLPHVTAFITDPHAWPVDGQISIIELSQIMLIVADRRCHRDWSRDQRYIPVTVVSGAGHLLRVLHAWHDALDPFKLNIRVSPVMSFKDPLSEDKLWDAVACFISGDPVIEEP